MLTSILNNIIPIGFGIIIGWFIGTYQREIKGFIDNIKKANQLKKQEEVKIKSTQYKNY